MNNLITIHTIGDVWKVLEYYNITHKYPRIYFDSDTYDFNDVIKFMTEISEPAAYLGRDILTNTLVFTEEQFLLSITEIYNKLFKEETNENS